jgi:tetratricopeptide (TPR) repeat protein
MLADLARFVPGPLLDEASRLTGTLSGEDRWPVLLGIELARLAADPAGAAPAFAAIRETIRAKERDPWFWTDDFWQVARAQAGAGDTAGARQTFAELLAGQVPGRARQLTVLTLAAIALRQAEAGHVKDARRIIRLARRHASGTREPVAWGAVALAQAAAGDLDAASATALAMLEMDDPAEGLEMAVHVARQLAEAGRHKQARRLLTEAIPLVPPFSHLAGDLASALAELGKDGKAARVADLDQTGGSGRAAGRSGRPAAGRGRRCRRRRRGRSRNR